MKKTLFLILLAFGMSAQAKMVDVTRSVTGVGPTYQEALNSALYTAVQQVRGAEVGIDKNVASIINIVSSKRSDIVTFEQNVTYDIYADTHGWLKSYEVLSINEPKAEGGQWTVKASVVVPRFETDVMPDDKRITIAVAPFTTSKSRYDIEGEVLSASDVSQRIAEDVQTNLTQNGRFAVVNRGQAQAMNKEFSLLGSNMVSAEQASRLGQIAGADFMVVGSIRHLGKPTRSKTYYGSDFNSNRIQVEISYQVVEVASQRMVWADNVRTITKPDVNFESYQLFDEVAHKIAAAATTTIYPVKVLDIVSNDLIYLTQGGMSVQVGDQLAVLASGKSVKDPDTGEQLMVNGPQLAVVEVTGVEAKYAMAKLLNGDVTQFSASSVLKPLAAVQAAPSAPNPVTPGSSAAPLKWN